MSHKGQEQNQPQSTDEMVREIYRRLLIDNGTPSFVTRLSKLEWGQKLVLWIVGIVAPIAIVSGCTLAYKGIVSDVSSQTQTTSVTHTTSNK